MIKDHKKALEKVKNTVVLIKTKKEKFLVAFLLSVLFPENIRMAKTYTNANGPLPLNNANFDPQYCFMRFCFGDGHGDKNYFAGHASQETYSASAISFNDFIALIHSFCSSVEVEVPLNSAYKATVTSNGIRVGCQNFPLDIVQKLAKAVEKVSA